MRSALLSCATVGYESGMSDGKAQLHDTEALSARIMFTGGKVLVLVSTLFEQVHNYTVALEQG